MNPTLMLTAAGAALFVRALTKSRWRNREAVRPDVLATVRSCAHRLTTSPSPRP
jgi:hypothetical protein